MSDKMKYIRQGIDAAKIAKETGFHKNHIYGVLNGQFQPSAKLALRIQEITGGIIKASDLRPDLKGWQ